MKDIRNLFKLEKLKQETTYTTNNNIKNLFRLEKENKAIKDIILLLEIFLSMKRQKIIINR